MGLAKNPVKPGWNGYDSPNKVSKNEPVVFFFPRHGGRYRRTRMDPDDKGWVVPRLFKRRGDSKQEKKKQRRDKKRAWRNMTTRMQEEIRFKRFPRDESGRVTMGQFRKQLDPKWKALQ